MTLHFDAQALSMLNAELTDFLQTGADTSKRDKSALRIKMTLDGLSRELGLDGSVHTFGSFSNGFKTGTSDLDVVFLSNKKGQEADSAVSTLQKFAENLPSRDLGFVNITRIFQASVPILKLTDKDSEMEVDFCVNNELGVRNSLLLNTYCKYDRRVLHLGRLVKEWAKKNELVGTADGCVNSYAYMLLVVFFLQNVQPPVVPNLQMLETESFLVCDRKWGGEDYWETKFLMNVESLPPSQNTMSIGELLMQFFHFYTREFNWRQHAVCIRKHESGKHVDKNSLMLPATDDQWYVEDPFDLKHNLAGKCSRAGKKRFLDGMKEALSMLQQYGRYSRILPDNPGTEFYMKCRISQNVQPPVWLKLPFVSGPWGASAAMPVKVQPPFQPALEKFCREEPLSLDEVLEVKSLLESKGSLDYSRAKCKDSRGKSTGPFSASAANAKGDHSGSSMFGSWLRDNCIIAYGIWLTDPDGAGGDDAVACLNAIATFLLTYQSHKMELVINGHKEVKGDEKTWMDRPHIRFIGETGKEDTKWYNHKQNDALGYFLWARCQLALAGKMPFTGEHLKLCGQLFDFLRVIECWDDLDAGHWEEHTAQHASSLGPVLAATRSFQQVLRTNPGWLFPGKSDTLTLLETKLEGALKQILPNEVITPYKNAKDADGALIFLCYPLDVVDQAVGAQILERIETITGHIAVCRYRKDSYWCKDYKELYADPTKHFTDEELKERDANIKIGEEAQWCLFDPMISAYYGKLYQRTKKEDFLKKQQLYLARALAAITGDDCEFGAWMCAEAFYLAKGKWQPNDNTPLVWTMVDLKMAIYEMEISLGGCGKPSSSSCTVS